MARKSKQADLADHKKANATKAASDPGRQPRVLGWLVLVVGAGSSWYWYRPLPDAVIQTVHSTNPSWPTQSTGPKSLWTDEAMVVPSTTGPFNSQLALPTDALKHLSEDSQLTGQPKVTLVPLNESPRDIRDVLKTERVPTVPVVPNLTSEDSPNKTPTWLPEHQRANPSDALLQPSSKWPDVGYVPPAKAQREQRRAATLNTNMIPPLLETGMKSIRTSESDESGNANQPNAISPPTQAPSSQQESERKPLFIRQPKRSN